MNISFDDDLDRDNSFDDLNKLSLLKSVNKHVKIYKCNSDVTSSIKQLKSKSNRLVSENIKNDSVIKNDKESIVRCLNMNIKKDNIQKIEEINSDNKYYSKDSYSNNDLV